MFIRAFLLAAVAVHGLMERGESNSKKSCSYNQNYELEDAKMPCRAEENKIYLSGFVTLSNPLPITHSRLIHC